MRGHRSKQRNRTRLQKVIDWIDSDSSQLLWIDGNKILRRSDFAISFATPIMILGESKYKTILILRHFCDDHRLRPGAIV